MENTTQKLPPILNELEKDINTEILEHWGFESLGDNTKIHKYMNKISNYRDKILDKNDESISYYKNSMYNPKITELKPRVGLCKKSIFADKFLDSDGCYDKTKDTYIDNLFDSLDFSIEVIDFFDNHIKSFPSIGIANDFRIVLGDLEMRIEGPSIGPTPFDTLMDYYFRFNYTLYIA